MSWTRLDDLWTEKPALGDLDYQARWHYLALIQLCSRTQRWDGVIPMRQALRASDVDDPQNAQQALHGAGLLKSEGAGAVRVIHIDEHIPPPSIRNNSKESRVRMQRHRKHKNGDHSDCLPSNCAHTPGVPVTGDVTRNTRTGQDRPAVTEASLTKPDNTIEWPDVREPGSSSSSRRTA